MEYRGIEFRVAQGIDRKKMEMVCRSSVRSTARRSAADTGDATRLIFLVEVGNIPQQVRHNDKRWRPS